MHEDMMIDTADEEKPKPTHRRTALVSQWLSKIKHAKKFHEKSFKQMRSDMDAVLNGYDQKDWSNENYVANILQRHVQQRTASLYAKNPKAVAKRRKRMSYEFWDGEADTLAQAFMASEASAQNGLPVPAAASMIIQDYMNGKNQNQMLDNVAKTLENLFDYYMKEQQPAFKSQMKGLVRRVITTGVGFVKVGFQRDVDRSPEVSAKIADVQAQVDFLRRVTEEASKGEVQKDDPQMEELMLSMQTLLEEPMVTIREGLVFDFPEANSIIVDPRCRQLRGFVGAQWIAHELYLTPDEVKEIYDVDLKKQYRSYDMKGRSTGPYDQYAQGASNEDANGEGAPDGLVQIYEVYDRKTGVQYCLADGHDDFLREPMGPDVKVETFWPIFSLVFNEIEHQAGQKVSDVIQPIGQIGIDPNLYEVRTIFDDIQLVVGAQESQFGGLSRATATETSIAESARMSTMGANVDELDTFMSEMTRAAGQVVLANLSIEEVKKIVGPGAVWPEMTRDQIMEEIYLEIEAGSTGKPNRAAELANIERIMPFLLQIPGIDPKWLAKELLKRLDDKLELDEAFADKIPSIVAMNQAQQSGTGDPALQGPPGGGADNAPRQLPSGGGGPTPMGANNQ